MRARVERRRLLIFRSPPQWRCRCCHAHSPGKPPWRGRRARPPEHRVFCNRLESLDVHQACPVVGEYEVLQKEGRECRRRGRCRWVNDAQADALAAFRAATRLLTSQTFLPFGRRAAGGRQVQPPPAVFHPGAAHMPVAVARPHRGTHRRIAEV